MSATDAADFYQAKSTKSAKAVAKAKERIARGEKAWAPTPPFKQFDVVGTAITVLMTPNINDEGEETQKCHLIQAISTDEFNRILDAVAGHGKGPIDNNNFGTFFKHTISATLQEDKRFMDALTAKCKARVPMTVTSAASDYNLVNKAGLTVEGWYGAYVRDDADVPPAYGSTA
jgi:hypothetical protein